jgi:ankyrin repeat domain-containing protein 50
MQTAVQALNQIRATQLRSTICESLKAPEATISYYEEACRKRHPETGLWFVKGAYFSTWLKEPNSLLWLNGFAGSGKSVLCSAAIQYTFGYRKPSQSIGIAFFFFTFKHRSEYKSAMLRALVLQLSNQLNDGHQILSQLYDRCGDTPPSDQTLIGHLHVLVRSFDDVYIFLDVLDEIPRRRT